MAILAAGQKPKICPCVIYVWRSERLARIGDVGEGWEMIHSSAEMWLWCQKAAEKTVYGRANKCGLMF